MLLPPALIANTPDGYALAFKIEMAAFLVAAKRTGRWPHRSGVGLAILIVTQIIYPLGYAAVKALALWASLLVLTRDLALLAWTASLLRAGDLGVRAPAAAKKPPVSTTGLPPSPRGPTA